MDFTSDKSIGEQIKEKCNELGISVAELSRRSGVSRRYFEHLKNDSLTIKKLRAITKVINEVEKEKK